MFVSISYDYKRVKRESLIQVKYVKRLDGAAGHCANIIFANAIQETPYGWGTILASITCSIFNPALAPSAT